MVSSLAYKTELGGALTGLRGIAAMVIVGHHLLLRLGPVDEVLMGLELHGYLAVDVFFVLSGFVMAVGYGTWFVGQRTGWPVVREYLDFMSRRVARVWPLHAAVLAILLLDGAVRHTGEFWPRMVLTNLLLVQSWGFSQTAIVPAWSVSTEMLAYAMFPLLGGVALRRGPGVAWLGLAGAVALVVAAVELSPNGPGQRGALDLHQNWSLLPAMRCLGEFSVGLLTWRALQDGRVWALVARRGVVAVVAALVVLLLGVGAPDLVVVACIPALIASLYAGKGAGVRLLAGRVLQAVGRGSYAMYLIHYPVLVLTGALVTLPWLVPAFISLLLPATLAAYWLVERPAQLALRRWSANSLTPVPALAAR